MTTSHTIAIHSNPYVTPTLSGAAALALNPLGAIAEMAIGVTAGSISPAVPQHNLYAYKITDPAATGSKKIVVLITGNHNTESTGNWTFQGMVDYLIGAEESATRLRQVTEFYVYPAVNPDGRYLGVGRGNPEMEAEGFGGDHNRVWHTQGQGLSTIDALTAAMQADTGGDADYFFDFHSANGWASSFFYLSPDQSGCPFELAFLDLNLGVGSSYYDVEGHPGVSMNWAKVAPGLNADYSFTPESNSNRDAPYYLDLGRNYGIALHNTLAPYEKASNPGPADMATSVGIATVLSWEEGWGAETHEVYFGESYLAVDNATSTSLELLGRVGDPLFSPGRLSPETTYYWRVDEVYPAGNVVKGDVWSFTTKSASEMTASARRWILYRQE